MVLDISSGISPCFPLTGGLCKLYANARGKWPIPVQNRQSPLSMHKFAPRVISGNDKNKPLTLLSQPKPTFTEEMWQRLCKFGGTSKKNRCDAYSGLFLSLYVIKSPIQLVRQSLWSLTLRGVIIRGEIKRRDQHESRAWGSGDSKTTCAMVSFFFSKWRTSKVLFFFSMELGIPGISFAALRKMFSKFGFCCHLESPNFDFLLFL